METLAIARIWAAAAWADDQIHATEAAAFYRFLEAAIDLDDAQREEASALLDARPTIAVADEVAKLSPFNREGVYRAVIAIVQIDGKVTDDELSFVTRLRDQLELDPKVVARIESEWRTRLP
jgi:uncharacterized tellurite resistance protein B-like protein